MSDGLTHWLGEASGAYGVIFLAASLCGHYGAFCLTKVPEPRMPPREMGARWTKTLITPVKNPNFRK